MRGDEGGVVRLPVERHHRQHHPRQPARHEGQEDAEDVVHRQHHLGPPLPHRPDPGKDLHRCRLRHQERGGREEGQRHVRDAHGEHVVHPQAEGQEHQPQDRRHDRAVAQDRGAAEDRDQGGHDARRGQEDDVDLGVAEQPEQVRPQQRIAAPGHVEKGPAEGPLQLQQDLAQDQRREAHQHHRAGAQHLPGKERHFGQPHPRGVLAQDGHGDLDRRGQRRDLDEGHAQEPDIGVDPGAVCGA